MLKAKHILPSFLIFLMFAPLEIKADFWNRLVRIESPLEQADFQLSADNSEKGLDKYKSFQFEMYSNRTFSLTLNNEAANTQLVMIGNFQQNSIVSFHSRKFIISGSQVLGSALHETNKGLKWTIDLKIKDKGLSLVREQVQYIYMNEISLIFFGIMGVAILPLSDRIRNKMLFNIRKRTSLSMSYIILLKLQLILACFLVNCYYYVVNSPWYHLFLVYGVYLFTISPSIIHSMYFMTAIQRQTKDKEHFKNKSATIKCMIMSFIILSIPLASVALAFVSKGISFYFLCSLVNVYQYVQACRTKKYGFGRVTLYDLLLTGILTIFSAFAPCLNFDLVTFKQLVLFWNYYLAIFIFGIVLTRIIIKVEIADQIYLQENNDSLPGPGESQRHHEMPKITTHQMLQS